MDPTNTTESTVALKKLNDKIAKDTIRVFAIQLNLGDGLTLAVKVWQALWAKCFFNLRVLYGMNIIILYFSLEWFDQKNRLASKSFS